METFKCRVIVIFFQKRSCFKRYKSGRLFFYLSMLISTICILVCLCFSFLDACVYQSAAVSASYRLLLKKLSSVLIYFYTWQYHYLLVGSFYWFLKVYCANASGLTISPFEEKVEPHFVILEVEIKCPEVVLSFK